MTLEYNASNISLTSKFNNKSNSYIFQYCNKSKFNMD